MPVWSNSVTVPIRFQSIGKKAAVKLWHRARDFERQTRLPGQHGGRIGHAAMQVLHALIFDFLNHRTGRLDPSYAALARKANVCVRTVAAAVARLRAVGVLGWVRRCAVNNDGTRRQETNAYAILPETGWLGYRPLEAPLPFRETWAAPPPLPDPADPLTVALERLRLTLAGVHTVQCNRSRL